MTRSGWQHRAPRPSKLQKRLQRQPPQGQQSRRSLSWSYQGVRTRGTFRLRCTSAQLQTTTVRTSITCCRRNESSRDKIRQARSTSSKLVRMRAALIKTWASRRSWKRTDYLKILILLLLRKSLLNRKTCCARTYLNNVKSCAITKARCTRTSTRFSTRWSRECSSGCSSMTTKLTWPATP